jgi:uncharacterized UBP type Zn finger protein
MPRYRCTVHLTYTIEMDAPDTETACEWAIDMEDPDYEAPMVTCEEVKE